MNRRQAMQAAIAATAGAALPAIAAPIAETMTFEFNAADFPRLKEIPGWTAGVDQALVHDGQGKFRWVPIEEC